MTEREALVAGEILRIAREELKLDLGPSPPSLRVGESGGGEALAAVLESMALLALVVAVEDRFHVVLADDDAAGTRTLEDLARLVAARAPEDRLALAGAPEARSP